MPLRAAVNDKFRRAFGPPDHVSGKEQRWALPNVGPRAPINVLVDSGTAEPMIWVFDPHDPKDGATNHRIHYESEIDALVTRIEDRVKNASLR